MPERQPDGEVEQRDGGHRRAAGQVREDRGAFGANAVGEAPPNRPVTISGSVPATAVSPVRAALPVVTSTNQGMAMYDRLLPTLEMPLAVSMASMGRRLCCATVVVPGAALTTTIPHRFHINDA